MKNYFSRLLLTVAVAVAASSCFVARQTQDAYNMTNCVYSYRSMTGLRVAGVDPANMSLLDAPRVLGLLTGGAQSVPVNFTLNINVKNPNATDAALGGVDYILSVDGIDLTAGSLDNRLSVPAGGDKLMPLAMAFDAATLLKGETHDMTARLVKNMMGIGGGEVSKITLNIRPSFMVAGRKVPFPIYIPINFSIGGER